LDFGKGMGWQGNGRVGNGLKIEVAVCRDSELEVQLRFIPLAME
jgi:hypothetical protein